MVLVPGPQLVRVGQTDQRHTRVSASSSTAERFAGGAGWRTGVPHILIYATDNAGMAMWPTTQDLGYASGSITPGDPGGIQDGGWSFPLGTDSTDWPAASFVTPYSTRASGSVHINAFKTAATAFDLDIDYALEDPPFAQPGFRDWILVNPGTSLGWRAGWARFGHVGDYWVGPDNGATVPMALEALASFDISVIPLHTGSETAPTAGPSTLGYHNVTLAELNGYATDPITDGDARLWEGDESNWFLRGAVAADPAWFGAALAHLTGAVDTEGKSLGWSLNRIVDVAYPFYEDYESLAARITQDLLTHAASLGDDQSFDVAFLMDDSGSFGGSSGRAQNAFLAVISALRAEQRDIQVAMSRYSEYGLRSFREGSLTERPFTLQYAMASVVDDAEYIALTAAIQQETFGSGGDSEETEIEGLYQLASGAGFDGNDNGSTADSGTAAVKGYSEGEPIALGFVPDNPYEIGTPEYTAYRDTEGSETGLGYLLPGWSGDVPAFQQRPYRGAANVGLQVVRVQREREERP